MNEEKIDGVFILLCVLALFGIFSMSQQIIKNYNEKIEKCQNENTKLKIELEGKDKE